MEHDTKPARKITDLTRAELHRLVWEQPLIRLAPDLGISGSSLAHICKHNGIPYPSGGHWTRVALGRTAVPETLPAPPAGQSDQIEIPPRGKSRPQPKSFPKAVIAVAKSVPPPVVLDLSELHPFIRAWVVEHERLQRERKAEIASRKKRDSWWPLDEIEDLTPRDIYRFRMTSQLLQGLEKAGVKVKNAEVNGKLSFGVGPHTVECVVIEKMTRRSPAHGKTWTAFPNHHQGGLVSTGFLRITVTTYLQPRIPEWVETAKRGMSDLIPDIVSRILGAGVCLDRMEAERRERERAYAEQVARREDIARRRQLEKARFQRFAELSGDWHKAQELNLFLAELRRRSAPDSHIVIEGRSLPEWITWTQQKIDALDPFRKNIANVFADFVKIDGI